MPRATQETGANRTHADAELLERGPELHTIEELLDAGVDGAGRALLIRGHPGLGKTRLYGVAVDRAHAQDQLVLRAAGSELEQDVAFGTAAQLLRSWIGSTPAGERAALLRDVPEPVRGLCGHGAAPGPADAEDGLAISHGLFVTVATAAETRPVLIAIDDLHWCDQASLGFIQYLLHRLHELPAALLLTSRPSEAGGDQLDSIAMHPAIQELSLTPLGHDAIKEMVARALGSQHAQPLTDTCLQTTGGNPFYLRELLLELAEDPHASAEQLNQRARSLAPATVARSLRVRVGRLGSEAGALARAVAILGDDVPLRTAATLAGLDVNATSRAADALASVDVLMAREPLTFVHPLIRTALEQDIPASQRASRHLEAARLLASEGESVERVAAHLLRGRPEGDPWAVEQLRAAAAEARSRGAAQSAVRYLERALAEPAPSDLQAELLAELGGAEAALGLEIADEHLALAAQTTDKPPLLAEIALLRGGSLYARARPEAAVTAYKEGLEQLGAAPQDMRGRELRERLQTALVLSAATVPSLQAEARRLSAEAWRSEPGDVIGQSERLLLAQASVEAAFGGRAAQVVIDLANRAWDHGRLLDGATHSAASWTLITAALCLAGDLERSLETAEAAATNARQRSTPLVFATATYMRACPQLWQGNIDGAVADLELARDARRYGWRQYARSAAAHYCLCMIEKGDLDRAERALVEDAPLSPPHDGEDAIRLYALAELRRAQGRTQEAYETAHTAGQATEAAIPYLGYCPWRCSAAQSALTLGRRDQARNLVQQELDRLKTTQVPHERIRALRLAGLCEDGEAQLSKLRAAVGLGEAHPPRLETIHALIAWGSALRRGKQRAQARLPLERAFHLARRGGASALAEVARTELAASGARPRREALSGPESLTASEQRVATLAAAGHSNREIATTLFVTPKTIEYHLRNCYRKLDIQTRRELIHALKSQPATIHQYPNCPDHKPATRTQR